LNKVRQRCIHFIQGQNRVCDTRQQTDSHVLRCWPRAASYSGPVRIGIACRWHVFMPETRKPMRERHYPVAVVPYLGFLSRNEQSFFLFIPIAHNLHCGERVGMNVACIKTLGVQHLLHLKRVHAGYLDADAGPALLVGKKDTGRMRKLYNEGKCLGLLPCGFLLPFVESWATGYFLDGVGVPYLIVPPGHACSITKQAQKCAARPEWGDGSTRQHDVGEECLPPILHFVRFVLMYLAFLDGFSRNLRFVRNEDVIHHANLRASYGQFPDVGRRGVLDGVLLVVDLVPRLPVAMRGQPQLREVVPQLFDVGVVYVRHGVCPVLPLNSGGLPSRWSAHTMLVLLAVALPLLSVAALDT